MEIEDCLVEVQTLFFREERMKGTFQKHPAGCMELRCW